MTKFLLSILLAILLTTQCFANCQPSDAEVEAFIKQEALRQGFVSYAFPIAVAQIEGRNGRKKYRTGLHGFGGEKVWLPFGIYKDYNKIEDCASWKGNCRVGIAVLMRKLIYYKGDKTLVLRHYNMKYTHAYRSQINLVESQYKTEEAWLRFKQKQYQHHQELNPKTPDTRTRMQQIASVL